MTSKLDYTTQLLALLPADHGLDVAIAMQDWWKDIRPDSGLRLSPEGYNVFKQLGIESHGFDIPPGTTAHAGHLIALNKHLTHPYFIQLGKAPRLVFFNGQEASMFALYGDIVKFTRALTSIAS
jgi:hypothetical protein